VNILNNEGHHPNGLGNQPKRTVLEELTINCRQLYDQNIDLIAQRDQIWRENQDLRAIARRAVDLAWRRAIEDGGASPSSKIVDEIIAAARGLALPPPVTGD